LRSHASRFAPTDHVENAAVFLDAVAPTTRRYDVAWIVQSAASNRDNVVKAKIVARL
jgi:hypothetical protein